MAVPIDCGVYTKKILFPLLNLFNDQSCELPVVSNFCFEGGQEGLAAVLKDGLLCEGTVTRHRCTDLRQDSLALRVRMMEI